MKDKTQLFKTFKTVKIIKTLNGKLVKAELKRIGVSQTKFSELLGFSKPYICDLLKERRSLSEETCGKIINVFIKLGIEC